LVIFYKKSSVRKYNTQLFEILAVEDNFVRIDKMEKLYRNKKIPKISKTLCGIKLSREYYKMGNLGGFIMVNEEIMKRENDPVFKNVSGLNLLHVKLNEEVTDVDYLEKLFVILENKKNPFLNVVLEKKAIFYIKQGKKEEAREIFNGLLLDDSNDIDFKNRIKNYIKIL
jgi:tetratricopeptide (TPR) repeat protein